LKFIQKYKIQIATLIGVALLAIGLLVDTVQTISPSINRAKNIIENRLHVLEKNADKVINSLDLIL